MSDTRGFQAGDRVRTPGGPGTVVYRRLAAPDFRIVGVYSVWLDAQAERPGYGGTIYPAAAVAADDEAARGAP